MLEQSGADQETIDRYTEDIKIPEDYYEQSRLNIKLDGRSEPGQDIPEATSKECERQAGKFTARSG